MQKIPCNLEKKLTRELADPTIFLDLQPSLYTCIATYIYAGIISYYPAPAGSGGRGAASPAAAVETPLHRYLKGKKAFRTNV